MPRPAQRPSPTHPDGRPMKITFGHAGHGPERDLGLLPLSHHVSLDAAPWPDEVRLSDFELRFVCQRCGARGADVRPDFERGNPKMAITGHRTDSCAE